MIPALTISGVLPPFITSPAIHGATSPYLTSMSEFATRFCTNQPRIDLFRGLIRLRKELRTFGFTQGAQWIDGSFVEDVERNRGRPPTDIDVVTLAVPPPQFTDRAVLAAFANANLKVFHPAEAKKEFGCEAFFIDLGLPAAHVVPQVTYWFGLFSHQRATYMWKGLLVVPLVSDDDSATAIIDGLRFGP